jgi:hypothetical protein
VFTFTVTPAVNRASDQFPRGAQGGLPQRNPAERDLLTSAGGRSCGAPLAPAAIPRVVGSHSHLSSGLLKADDQQRCALVGHPYLATCCGLARVISYHTCGAPICLERFVWSRVRQCTNSIGSALYLRLHGSEADLLQLRRGLGVEDISDDAVVNVSGADGGDALMVQVLCSPRVVLHGEWTG